MRSSRSAWLRALVVHDQGEGLQSLRRGIDRARTEGPRSRQRLAQMLLELGWRQRSLGMEGRYRELVDQAREAAPDDPVVELALVDRTVEQGYAWLGLVWLRDLVRRYPQSESLRDELATRLQAQGHAREALAVLEKLADERGGTRAVVGQRIELLLDLGEADAAAELAHRAATASPGLPAVHETVARLEEARGDVAAARAAMARAIALAPHDADLHAGLGRLLARTGDRPAAIASLRRSLELRPQQPDVRDLLASLDVKGTSDLFTRYAVDLEKVGAVPTPASWKGKEAGVLHHRVAVKVLPNGLTERLDHRIIRIIDDRGVRSEAVQATTFDPDESIVEVRRARVRRKDGRIEELGDVQMLALASAGFRMFYDQRQNPGGVRGPAAGRHPGGGVPRAGHRRAQHVRHLLRRSRPAAEHRADPGGWSTCSRRPPTSRSTST